MDFEAPGKCHNLFISEEGSDTFPARCEARTNPQEVLRVTSGVVAVYTMWRGGMACLVPQMIRPNCSCMYCPKKVRLPLSDLTWVRTCELPIDAGVVT